MLLRKSKQTQEVGTCLDSSTAIKQVVTSMSQFIYQLIEGPFIDWPADDSLYANFKPGNENVKVSLEVELARCKQMQILL